MGASSVITKPAATATIKASEATPATTVRPAWPPLMDTAEAWKARCPHFTDAGCEKLAAAERARIEADRPLFAQLVAGLLDMNLTDLAEHTASAAAAGFPFNLYADIALGKLQAAA